MKKIFWIITVLFWANILQAQDVKADSEFGENGKVITDFGRTATIGVEAVTIPDNKLILEISGREWYKISWTGENDFSFGDNGVVKFRTNPPHIMQVREDGKFLALQPGTNQKISCVISRFHTDGLPDLSFGKEGNVSIYNTIVDSVFSWDNEYFRPAKLILLNEGRILIAGKVTGPSTWGGTKQNGVRLYAYDRHGNPDISFASNGVFELKVENLHDFGSVAVTPNGHIIISFTNYREGGMQYSLVKLDEAGIPDTGFGQDGRHSIFTNTYIGGVKGIWIGKDGKIISYGSYISDFFSGLYKSTWFVVQKNDGQPDTRYNGTGIIEIPDFYTQDFIRQNTKGFMIAGFNSPTEVQIKPQDYEIKFLELLSGKLTNIASYDNLFAGNRDVAFIAQCYAVDSMYLISTIKSGYGFLFAYDKNFNPDNSFAGEGYLKWNTGISNARAKVISQKPDGKLILAGIATNYEISKFITSRYRKDGTEEYKVINNNYDVTDNDLVIRDGVHFFVTATDKQNNLGLLRIDDNGTPDILFGNNGWVKLPANAKVYDVRKTNESMYLVTGTFGSASSTADTIFFMKLFPDGIADLSYGVNGTVLNSFPMPAWVNHQFIIHPDGMITVMGVGNHCLITRYNYDGSRNKNFGTNGVIIEQADGNTPESYRIQLLQDGSFIYGKIHDRNLVISKYSISGKPDTEFGNSGISRVPWQFVTELYSIVAQSDGKIIFGGNAEETNGFMMIRINKDGTPDINFGTNGLLITPLDFPAVGSDIALQADGKIIQAGYLKYEDDADFVMVRYINDLNVGIIESHEITSNPVVYPNPVSNEANINFELNTDQSVSLYLTDANGRIVRMYQQGINEGKGLHSKTLDFRGLTNGFYIIKISTPDGSKAVRVIIMNDLE